MPKLNVFDSADFEKVDDIADIKNFYRLLYNLNQATLLMSQATSIDDLYHVAVKNAIELLEIDRMGILLIDEERKEIQGKCGTDEQRQDLYEFYPKNKGESSIVGFGWNGAIALWENEKLIGWVACDNLIKHRPFKSYISHILRLFSSVISEYRLRFLAQEKVENLNKTLEIKVQKHTCALIEAQNKLQIANQD